MLTVCGVTGLSPKPRRSGATTRNTVASASTCGCQRERSNGCPWISTTHAPAPASSYASSIDSRPYRQLHRVPGEALRNLQAPLDAELTGPRSRLPHSIHTVQEGHPPMVTAVRKTAITVAALGAFGLGGAALAGAADNTSTQSG